MFLSPRKKFKVRVRRSTTHHREVFYVEYAYYRFFPTWKVLHHWLVNAQTTLPFVKSREKAEEFALQLPTIEKVRKYEKLIFEKIQKHDKNYETKIIIDD